MAAELQELIDEVRALSPEDQARLREVLEAELAGRVSRSGEGEFQRRLLEKGLLKTVKPPVTDLQPYQDREPLEIHGKPISETIVEERR